MSAANPLDACEMTVCVYEDPGGPLQGRRGHLKGPRGLASRTWGPPPRATRAQATLEARMRAVGQVVFRVCVWHVARCRIGVLRIQTVPGMAQRHSTRCRWAQTENVVYMGVPNSNGPRSGHQEFHPLSYVLISLFEEVPCLRSMGASESTAELAAEPGPEA